MPKAPSAPAPINVPQTTAASMAANQQTAQTTQGMNTIGQNNPIGNLSYTTTIDPITGLPKYQANESYTPEQEAIFRNLQGNQTGIGLTAGQDISSNFGQYGQPLDLVGGANSLTNQALDSQIPAWERFNAPMRDQLRTQLINQGLTEGSPAYQQQMDKLVQQQQLNEGQFLSSFQPQAFQEATTQQGLPLMQVAQMLALSQPGSINQNLANTPSVNMANTDVGQLTTTAQQEAFQNYQQQVARQNAMMSMATGGIGAILGMPVNPASMPGGGSYGANMVAGIMGR